MTRVSFGALALQFSGWIFASTSRTPIVAIFPVVTILVDGANVLADPGGTKFIGFDPEALLGVRSPLLPSDSSSPCRRLPVQLRRTWLRSRRTHHF